MAYSEYPSSSMGLKDDIFYTTVEVRLESYPRIKHFQSELQDLFCRFQRIYEKLPESLMLSVENVCSLSDAVHQLATSGPVLCLFGSTHSKIHTKDLVRKRKPHKIETHPIEEMHTLGENEKNYKLLVAVCTLRMMDTKKGRDTLQKVRDFFGVENMMFFVDKAYELNRDLVGNNLACLEDLLKLKKKDTKVVYESKKEMISNDISNHMEHKFVHAFQSLNMFLLEITKKRSRTYGSAFGDKGTGGRFFREIKEHFGNILTLIDLLVTSKGESAEQKLATAIVSFTKPVLIREIANTYEMQDVKVFDYWQKENYNDIWIQLLQKHLYKVPFVTKLYQFIKNPNDESVKCDLQKHYTEDDAKTIGKEVTKVLMGCFLQVGTNVKKIRANLDLLIQLRKELIRLTEETIDGDKYDEGIPELDKWRKQLEGIKEVEAVSLVFGKFVVFLKKPESTEREREVRRQIQMSLKGYPGDVVVQCCSHAFFSGRHGTRSNSRISMGDAFLSGSGNRGTIGLFMHEEGTERRDLHFVTSSHVVLVSNIVKTNDHRPVRLGTTRHALLTEDGLVDIAAIRIEGNIQHRCNVFFQSKNVTCQCTILDMDGIRGMKEGKHVYKKGSATGETRGCIISEDFRRSGLQDHNFLVSLPAGVDEAKRNIGFAREGDSGAVLYTKTPDGQVQYIAILMGEFILRYKEDNLYSTFKNLREEMGSLINTTCLWEGLNRIEQKFNLKLSLPTI